MQGTLLVEIVAQGGLIVISEGHPAHPGKDRARVNLRNSSEVDPAWSQLTAIHHREKVLIPLGLPRRHDSDLEGPIAASFEERVRDAKGWQGGAK